MRRLLSIAAWCCGDLTKASVFEPLLADWQHELDAARTEGRWRYAAALSSGAFAYTRSLARCTINRGGWLPTARAAQIVALTAFVALDAAFLLIWIAAMASSGQPLEPGAAQTQYFLLASAGIAVPPIVLPALFLMRRDAQTTVRHAVTAIAAGAALTAGAVTLTAPERLNAYFSTFESFERQYQRTLANDRAGNVTYPGTAVRALRGPTTIEQRRAQYEQFMARRAEQKGLGPTSAWPQQVRRYYPVALAVLFGMIGWTLGGLAAPTFARAATWWSLMYVALLAFAIRPMPIGLPSIGRVPDVSALAFFGAMAVTLVIASWHRHWARRPRHEAQSTRH